MGFLNIIGSSVFQLLSFVFVLVYLFGVLNIHFSDKNEYCEMTYMFEYPQFVRISVPENSIYPQYGLYAYSEGRFTERARKMWFDGVPVLFLPGNSGSHMQARSLASVALRKAVNQGYEYHFDYFTIGFNEELSGLYGGVLESQTKFAAACISKILSLYKSNKYTKTVPTTVILIGHSMGGVIAKRLLAYPLTTNSTSIAITLAAPLEAPVVNFDVAVDKYYSLMSKEWKELGRTESNDKKILLSFGNGPRDILMPSGLTSSNYSFIGGLTTAIPGVWVSPDHVGIVWCKQLVMAINRYLFAIVDPSTEQVSENKLVLTGKARQFFQANRSMILNPDVARPTALMVADAFWYEDNRRIYQISRPEIDKTTYLMIRLVRFPQNRFVAIESVNASDKDWIFGCNAMHTHNTYRYCKQATSLTELSRWSGAAVEFGRRKLATIHLHDVMDKHPDWTHVIVKVSPTRKPIILNVDINDHASRQITVNLPVFGTSVLKHETERGSIYYELILPDLNSVFQSYLLYVEPTASCKASRYHVSAELHVPWARNHEYYHFFTHIKRSPMKLRLYKSNPNMTKGLDPSEYVKVTLLLDPQCTFSISVSSSIYHRLAQIARNYTPVLVPYMAAIVLMAVRSNILHLKQYGKVMTIHGALMSDRVKPYYVLAIARFGYMLIASVPILRYIFENASWHNIELQRFARSMYVVPAYMTALGMLHIAAAVTVGVMVFSSQLAYRWLFKILWRSRGGTIAEKVATGLQKVPVICSIALIMGVPLSCGAASLVAGAAFYSFMLSKMYEEYLEDYVYKLMAKVASKVCKLFKKRERTESEISLVLKEDMQDESSSEVRAIENKKENKEEGGGSDEIKKEISSKQIVPDNKEKDIRKEESIETKESKGKESNQKKCEDSEDRRNSGDDIDEDLNNLNFHMMLFFMWMCVTLVNVPALLTWARNFKYSMVLSPDTSYHTGLMMSACSACLWQMRGPRKNLKYYDALASLLFATAAFILILGPFYLDIVNKGITFMYVTITVQQLFDQEEHLNVTSDVKTEDEDDSKENEASKNNKSENVSDDTKAFESSSQENQSGESPRSNEDTETENVDSSECVCNENRIYTMFKNLRDKFSFTEEDVQ